MGFISARNDRQGALRSTSSLSGERLWANGYNAQAALCGAWEKSDLTDRAAREVASMR